MIPKLTANGYSLMIRALDGEGLTFSKIKIGNGDMPEDFLILEDLQNPLIEVGIEEITKLDKYVKIKAVMSNKDYDSGFDWTEAGIYVVDPDGGEADILYAYSHYQISGDEKPLRVPAFSSNLVEIIHYFHVFIGELDDVTAILADSSEYAKASEFKNHVEDKNNPHGVTKIHVGLGNVPNVTPENQQPIFSNAYGTVTVSAVNDVATGAVIKKTTFANIASGERMGSILNKIRTAFYVVLNHLNGSNPHSITPKLIGAAAISHNHSASDINKGILGIPRGGTGGNTPVTARMALGIQSGHGGIVGKAGQAVTAEFNFLNEFDSAPKVVVTPITSIYAGNEIYLAVKEVTTTGFTLFLYSETLNPIINFYWIAIQ